MTRTRISVLVVAAFLALPMTASAASAPVFDQYGNPVAAENEGPAATLAAGDDTVGGLPFTGAELGMLMVAGFAIGGSGVALRRIGASNKRGRRGSAA
jgi:hypothetical protein